MAKGPAPTSRGEARSHPGSTVHHAQHHVAPNRPAGGERPAESRLVIRGPASGRRVALFSLPDVNGRVVDLWSYRQRLNLVLFFHHGARCAECRTILRGLAGHLAGFREEETTVLAIGPDDPTSGRQLADLIDGAFPLLSDPSGHAVAEQGLGTPALVVSDRYGDIWAAWMGGEQHLLPNGAELGRWIEFVEMQCPECSVAEWPAVPGDVLMEL